MASEDCLTKSCPRQVAQGFCPKGPREQLLKYSSLAQGQGRKGKGGRHGVRVDKGHGTGLQAKPPHPLAIVVERVGASLSILYPCTCEGRVSPNCLWGGRISQVGVGQDQERPPLDQGGIGLALGRDGNPMDFHLWNGQMCTSHSPGFYMVLGKEGAGWW